MVRVGIVGSRFSAGLHAQAYQRTGKVELIAASAIDNLNEFCRKYRIADSYRDFREMLKRDDIELVGKLVVKLMKGYGVDEIWPKNLSLEGLNIIVSSHVGSDTDRGKLGMQLMSTQAVVDFMQGKVPQYLVNKEVLESR